MQLDQAIASRTSQAPLDIHVSADSYHATPIDPSAEYLANIVRVYQEMKLSGQLSNIASLSFRGLSVDGRLPQAQDGDPIMQFLSYLEDEGAVRGFQVVDAFSAKVFLTGDVEIQASYNPLAKENDVAARDQHRELLHSQDDPGLRDLLINHDGTVNFGRFYPAICLGHVSDLDPSQIAPILDSQIIFNALRDRGFKYLLDLASEQDPEIETTMLDRGFVFPFAPHVTVSRSLRNLLGDQRRRLYIERRILQDLSNTGF